MLNQQTENPEGLTLDGIIDKIKTPLGYLEIIELIEHEVPSFYDLFKNVDGEDQPKVFRILSSLSLVDEGGANRFLLKINDQYEQSVEAGKVRTDFSRNKKYGLFLSYRGGDEGENFFQFLINNNFHTILEFMIKQGPEQSRIAMLQVDNKGRTAFHCIHNLNLNLDDSYTSINIASEIISLFGHEATESLKVRATVKHLDGTECSNSNPLHMLYLMSPEIAEAFLNLNYNEVRQALISTDGDGLTPLKRIEAAHKLALSEGGARAEELSFIIDMVNNRLTNSEKQVTTGYILSYGRQDLPREKADSAVLKDTSSRAMRSEAIPSRSDMLKILKYDKGIRIFAYLVRFNTEIALDMLHGLTDSEGLTGELLANIGSQNSILLLDGYKKRGYSVNFLKEKCSNTGLHYLTILAINKKSAILKELLEHFPEDFKSAVSHSVNDPSNAPVSKGLNIFHLLCKLEPELAIAIIRLDKNIASKAILQKTEHYEDLVGVNYNPLHTMHLMDPRVVAEILNLAPAQVKEALNATQSRGQKPTDLITEVSVRVMAGLAEWPLKQYEYMERTRTISQMVDSRLSGNEEPMNVKRVAHSVEIAPLKPLGGWVRAARVVKDNVSKVWGR